MENQTIEENKLIKVEDLRVGDEVIVGSAGTLAYYRILRNPQIRTKTLTWNRGTYKAIKVKMLYEPIGLSSKYDKEKYFDFNYTPIWLVKKRDEYGS